MEAVLTKEQFKVLAIRHQVRKKKNAENDIKDFHIKQCIKTKKAKRWYR